MANSIALAQAYLPILDAVYKAASKTSVLEAAAGTYDFNGVDTVKIFKTSMDGMGDYNRAAGFVNGGVTGTWETFQLSQDRGRSFQIDEADNSESMNLAFGTLAGEFIRTKVVPEVDAYTFAKMAGTSGITSANADITVGTTDVPSLIQTAEQTMGDDEVPDEGRILFVSEKCYSGLKAKIDRRIMNGEGNINTAVDYYDNMLVVKVPKGRFATKISMYDGTTAGETAGGYVIPTDGTAYDINFMVVHPSAVKKVTKLLVPRIFSPEVNQRAYAWQYDFRTIWDVFVEANKVKGIYLHRAATAIS